MPFGILAATKQLAVNLNAIPKLLKLAEGQLQEDPFPLEILAYVKSRTKGLTPKIKSMANAKPAEQVKLAKAIETIAKQYQDDLNHIKDIQAFQMLRPKLTAALNAMRRQAFAIVTAQAASVANVQALNEAQEKWSTNKIRATEWAKQRIKVTEVAKKEHNEDFGKAYKVVKEMRDDELIKWLLEMDNLSEEKQKQGATKWRLRAEKLQGKIRKADPIDAMQKFCQADLTEANQHMATIIDGLKKVERL